MSPYKAIQIDPNSIKKYLLLEIKTVAKPLLFRMKNIIKGGCLFDDSLTRFLIAQVLSFYQLIYCFLMSSEICKMYREY